MVQTKTVKQDTTKELSPLEKDFLAAYLMYVSKKSRIPPHIKVGTSFAVGKKILSKLAKNSVIFWDKKKKRYGLSKDYEQSIISDVIAKKTRSVFTPKTLELYKKLKSKQNIYVFPEVPICAFIEQSAVSKIIKTKEQFGYFLTSRVDFLITDLDGNPIEVYEFQGTYHNSQKQKKIDSFKKSIINAVGLKVIYVNSKTLSITTKQT